MVDYTNDYTLLLQRGASVYDDLMRLYAPDKKVADDWFGLSETETKTYRNGLLERLAKPRTVTAEDASTFVVSTGHYLDSHWADYTTYPVASPDNKEYPATDPEKRQRLLQLHGELKAVIDGVGNIYKALRTR